MGILADYRAGRLIEQVLAAKSINEPKARDALTKLKTLGKSAIPRMIEVLASTDREQYQVFSEILSRLLDTKTLPLFAEALKSGNNRIVTAVTQILKGSESFNPNQLLPLLAEPEVSKPALLSVLQTHRERLDALTVLRQAGRVEPKEQAALFGIIADMADESVLSELTARAEAKDAQVRMQVIRILSRFNRPDVRLVLERLIRDPHKGVRYEAIKALKEMDPPTEIAPVCRLLRDPDLNVQNEAVEAVVKFRHPKTLEHLLDVLQDESEYARRAAVEVLNEIADAKALKDLLFAIKDRDWWVRERAADALIKIGGPRVTKAMLELIKDKDEFVRRTAIEVINANQDPEAFGFLIKALEDKDWWVRERAIDALASIGNPEAVPALLKVLQNDPQVRPVTLRALATIGDKRAIPRILPYLKDEDTTVQKSALHALSELTDKDQAPKVQAAIGELVEHADVTVRRLAQETLGEIQARIGTPGPAAPSTHGRVPAGTADTGEHALGEAAAPGGEAGRSVRNIFNPAELESGMLLADRYRVVKRIGKGAFGTVVLFHDEVVSEDVILKFVNPQFSSDPVIHQRFVHEIRFARKITHPNVIRIYDYLSFGECSAISMEYFPGHTLADELRSNEPMGIKRFRDIILQITAGLGAAHEAGIVHRDIKPANILLDEDGLVKVVDFGIAAAAGNAETRLTRTGMVVGTPTYLAPEQVLGKPVDNRTDIYSLAVIMYQMLAGHPPYKGEDAMSLMYQHVQGNATPLYVVNPSITKTLSAIVQKAMAVDPDKRYQSMEELRAQIDKLPVD